MLNCFVSSNKDATPINVITQRNFSAWLTKQDAHLKNWLNTNGFRAEPGCVSLIPDAKGKFERVVICIADNNHFWSVGSLPLSLPEGAYFFDVEESLYEHYAIVWGLGAYQFTTYKKAL